MHIAVDLVILTRDVISSQARQLRTIHYTHGQETHSMMDEYAYGKDVWFTGVINKSANVPIILGINAVQLMGTFLQIETKLEIDTKSD